MTYKRLFYASTVVILLGMLLAFLAVQKLGGWKYTAHRLHTLEAWPMYTQRLSQLELLPTDSGAVVLLGDSHVAFGAWSEWLPAVSVANRGIPGEGIEGLSAFAKTLNLDPARIVFVQIGTNDLLFHEVEEVIVRYQAMIDEFSARRLPVVYCTLPGVNNQVRWTGIDAEDVKELNTYITAQKEHGIQILDLAATLETQDGVLPEGLTDDGVHLKGQGYSAWVSQIFYHLNRVVLYD